MDPNLFHVDWDRLGEVLVLIIVLAFLLERALALVFEHRLFVQRFEKKGAKEFVAFGVAAVVCVYWDFDALSMIILTEETHLLGQMLTAGIIAGGSKGSIKLFRDVMGIKSSAVKEKEEAATPRQPSVESKSEAEAKPAKRSTSRRKSKKPDEVASETEEEK